VWLLPLVRPMTLLRQRRETVCLALKRQPEGKLSVHGYRTKTADNNAALSLHI
jgi:hypothetical protein